MANMNEKGNKISQLLSELNLTIVNENNNHCICGICKGIINDAHQANCGCNFCFACANQMIENGRGKCLACNNENVSEIAKNYGLNFLISKMLVRCPNGNCGHECKLINMDEHLRLCTMRTVGCPFSDFGCQLKEISSDKLNDHFMSNIIDHSKIFIELINQLRNEMRELKENEYKNQSQIEKLIANDTRKDEAIESLRNEIRGIKEKNKELKTLMRNNDNNLWDKLDQIDIDIDDRCRNDTVKSINDAIESMRINKSDLENQIKIINKKCQELNGNAQDIHQVKADRDKMTKSIDRINKFLKMRHRGGFGFQIGKINEIKWMFSDIFHDYQNQYQMRLRLENTVNELNIRLGIYSGSFDEELQWPVKAKITINIVPMIDDYKSKSITKCCTINRPKIDSSVLSDKLSFSHVDLATFQMLDNNCFLRCLVKFE